MQNLLQSWDRGLLQSINLGLIHPINDALMRLWSAEWPWMLLALLFLIRRGLQKDWASLKTFLWIGLTIGVVDFVAAQLIKPWAGRIRPCKVEGLVRIVDGCGGMMSFPSNHASNAAAFAVFWFAWAGPKQGLMAAGMAFLIGFSRVYLGVHYPGDILAGFCFGATIGALSALLFRSDKAQAWVQKKKGAVAP